MKYVKLFLFGGETRWGTLRPVWQMLLLFPFWVLYQLADKYVNFFDRSL